MTSTVLPGKVNPEQLIRNHTSIRVARDGRGRITVFSERGKAGAHFGVVLGVAITHARLGLMLTSRPKWLDNATPTSVSVPLDGGIASRTVHAEGAVNTNYTVSIAKEGTHLLAGFLALDVAGKQLFTELQQSRPAPIVEDLLGTPLDATVLNLDVLQKTEADVVLDCFPLAREIWLAPGI